MTSAPLISVFLSARNEGGADQWRYPLETTLNSLADAVAHARREDSVEVLVSDWGSEQPIHRGLSLSESAKRLARFLTVPPDAARRFGREDGTAAAPALNAALRRCRGRYLMQTGPGALADAELLQLLLELVESERSCMGPPDRLVISARSVPIPPEIAELRLPPEKLLAALIERGPAALAPRASGFGLRNTGMIMMHRRLWDECSGFDERLAGRREAEIDLGQRLLRRHPWLDLTASAAIILPTLECGPPEDAPVSAGAEVFAPNGEGWGLKDEPLKICSASGESEVQAPAERRPPKAATEGRLPIHFFTIVLNGMPFIRYHIEAFRRLDCPWQWHIVEGVAELAHCTAWSAAQGGRIADETHRRGRSIDGTTEYLDALASAFPGQVHIYRKPPGLFWNGKIEMVNAPLADIKGEALLWEVDADELWRPEQIMRAREIFLRHPERTAAFYLCHYFVGPELLIASRDTYGNHTDYEWLRTWRFIPGARFASHEPPRLAYPLADGRWIDAAQVHPIRHAETEAAGLVFQHYAYVLEEQLRFKETYYGYRGAVDCWRRLQTQPRLPLRLAEYFHWVNDEATVDSAQALGVTPLARPGPNNEWNFFPLEALC